MGGAAKNKKKIEQLPQAPNLVGRVVEKGFSSSPSNPPSAPLPRPTVLPFPVARHRSHGPHWSPANAELKTDESNKKEDKENDADYDPISSFANPIERKKKKGLDVSRWREFVRNDESKKKDAETITVKQGKRKISSSKTIEETLEKPVKATGSERKAELADEIPKTLEKPVAKVEPKPFEFKREVEFQTVSNGLGSSTLVDDIDEENLGRLNEMSSEEIAEAQEEIMEKMDPNILEMLKKRGRDKLGKKKGTTLEPGDKGQQNSGNGQSVQGGDSSKTKVLHGDLLQTGEAMGRSWKVWSERVERVRALRFSLEGNVMEADSTQDQANGNKSDCLQYSVDNVAERDFLRTEGDPAAVGYTITEAIALIRSVVPGQRAFALQLLASVLDKALHSLQRKNVEYCIESHIANLIDWQAVWAFALGPEPQLALSLRIALDDNHDSVVFACAKAIQCILCCDMNESFFNTLEKVPTNGKDPCTAPVFRGRPGIDGGFLRGGYWKYNTKPSNILPFDDENIDDEGEGKHTIQDDVVVAGQDIAAGLIRMEILPRICYLLEMDPPSTLEECLVSILIALARHSPTSASAIMRCPRLIPTVLKMCIRQGAAEIPAQTKAIVLLKVLSQSDKQICSDLVKRGVFQQAMWHWYRSAFTLDNWVRSGRDHCKLTSTLMVEQLRLWKVCIHYGYCIACFADFFPTMCLWLSLPTFDVLIEKNVLVEFASITREAYLVLEALAQRLPCLHSMDEINKKAVDNDTVEAWSWSHAIPMVDLAISWLALKTIPCVSSVIDCYEGSMGAHTSSASSMIWVISAVLHMLCSIIDRIAPNISNDLHNKHTQLPWLPQFVPKVGLEIIRNRFLNFVSSTGKSENFPSEGGALAGGLCYLRQQDDLDVSLSSVSCLHGLVRLAFLIDNSIQRAKNACYTQSLKGRSSGIEDRMLEEGLVKWANDDLMRVLTLFMTLVSSEWNVVQSVEMFGRGGPAPGIGFGWGSFGGGFWSLSVLLAQVDAQLILEMFECFPLLLKEDLAFVEGRNSAFDISASSMTLTLQRINSVLAVCLVAGPRDGGIIEKAFNILLQAPVLKYLGFCMHSFVHRSEGLQSFQWQYVEEEYLLFSEVLNSHYRNRWTSIKKKSSEKTNKDSQSHEVLTKGKTLETIHEDQETQQIAVKLPDCSSLLIEWAHQRLPLPTHWFLSAIGGVDDTRSVSEVTKSGLFLLLALESMSSFLWSESQQSPILIVPLVWKLHSLSMALHAGMDVLEDEKSREVFRTLQELYGQHLDRLRCRASKAESDNHEKYLNSSATLPEAQDSGNLEVLSFRTQVHESYTTFLENLVEQFGAISYGDVIYGRQVALYLHRSVELPVRLAAWKALSNAHVLELLPPLEKCFAEPVGYLEPVEENEAILEAYAKSWVSGALDRAAARGSVSFTLALHHLSCFIFRINSSDKISLRNKLVKSLLRSYSHKHRSEGMLLSLIQYKLPMLEDPLYKAEIGRRFKLLVDACEGNSSLLTIVDNLKSTVIVDGSLWDVV